jgi:hypothetical protein
VIQNEPRSSRLPEGEGRLSGLWMERQALHVHGEQAVSAVSLADSEDKMNEDGRSSIRFRLGILKKSTLAGPEPTVSRSQLRAMFEKDRTLCILRCDNGEFLARDLNKVSAAVFHCDPDAQFQVIARIIDGPTGVFPSAADSRAAIKK